MSRKDYIVIATGLRRMYLNLPLTEQVEQGWSIAVTGVMNALKSDNPNFNDDIFLNYIKTGSK